jgi:uncharacterized protein (DUF2062 family)
MPTGQGKSDFMQRWLKRITPKRDRLEKHWFFKPYTAIFSRAQCWTFHRSSVTRAFALGLFIAFIPPVPPLPLHLILCTTFGIMLRLNLPVLFATSFVSNPFTWLQQVVVSVWIGAKLMGLNFMPFVQQLTHQHMREALHHLWAPLLLGALVLGSLAATAGYALAQGLWRARVLYLLRRRRARSNARGRVLGQGSVD